MAARRPERTEAFARRAAEELGVKVRAVPTVGGSSAQAAGYSEPHILPTDRMVDLSAVLPGAATGRTGPDEITVFCSVGLAGTEVAVAAALWEVSQTQRSLR